MRSDSEQIAANLAEIGQRIAAAAARSGRAPEAVRLVAVTKYVEPARIAQLVACGCRDLGESRPQQLWERAESITAADLHWHMIGHLQRNKVRRTLPLVRLIHSIDTVDLLEAVDRIAGEQQRTCDLLLEVNTSGEEAKHGFAPDDVAPALAAAARLASVRVRGLMCMAALDGGLDVARANFAALRDLRDRLAKNCPDTVRLDELSMGMSGDYEVAIEEGATLVRIGSALFEGLDAP